MASRLAPLSAFSSDCVSAPPAVGPAVCHGGLPPVPEDLGAAPGAAVVVPDCTALSTCAS
eukprot:3537552-Pyramimonas_sp.AAC.1